MSKFLHQANEFFTACEAGKGWAATSSYCTSGAVFSSEALPDIKTVEDYTNWMKGLIENITPDGRYELHSTTYNETTVTYYATFFGTHTLPGGPVPPSDPPKKCSSDYVYIIEFNDEGKIAKMSKVWNNLNAFKQFGWA
eukprot:TRINITY_DN8374_c0_g1_i1.p1 TRINITY_DN8374_c0_g1~~TRINITY_DN8374_c0_g1_i1.p1  ORF type:complete len:147 (+),score=39.75 TRINITY_DN8374_c0_g1_i1:25-441(+)